MDKTVRFAIIGAGSIAQSYVQAFEGCSDVKLVAVADVRAEAAHALAERCGCASYPSHQALIKNGSKIDAVLICTPPNTHEAIGTFFLERGVHVLCEKPFTLDARSA